MRLSSTLYTILYRYPRDSQSNDRLGQITPTITCIYTSTYFSSGKVDTHTHRDRHTRIGLKGKNLHSKSKQREKKKERSRSKGALLLLAARDAGPSGALLPAITSLSQLPPILIYTHTARESIHARARPPCVDIYTRILLFLVRLSLDSVESRKNYLLAGGLSSICWE